MDPEPLSAQHLESALRRQHTLFRARAEGKVLFCTCHLVSQMRGRVIPVLFFKAGILSSLGEFHERSHSLSPSCRGFPSVLRVMLVNDISMETIPMLVAWPQHCKHLRIYKLFSDFSVQAPAHFPRKLEGTTCSLTAVTTELL